MFEIVSWQLRETLEQERYESRLRRSEMSRLVKQLKVARPRDGFHCRALTWLGHQMILWGWSLQERYGSRTPASALGRR
jgi:hypothetical protein